MFHQTLISAITTLMFASIWMPGIGQQRTMPPATRLPAKSYTLADPAKAFKKPPPRIDLYSMRYPLPAKPLNRMQFNMADLGWGWFCHAEHRFRQTTKVPLFIRLGSVEQTERLEGK